MTSVSRFRPGRFLWSFALVVVVGLYGPVAVADPAGPPTKPFSGEMVLKSGDRPPLVMKVAHTTAKTRIEMTIAGRKLIQIVDRTAKKVFVLLPHKQVFLESALTPRRDVVAVMVPKDSTIRKVGEETVSGTAATKYEMTGRNPQGRTFTGHLWRTVDGNIVVRLRGTVTKDGQAPIPFSMNMKNLSLDAPKDRSFIIPAGYQRFSPKK